jgi:hypothetical protein
MNKKDLSALPTSIKELVEEDLDYVRRIDEEEWVRAEAKEETEIQETVRNNRTEQSRPISENSLNEIRNRQETNKLGTE